MFLINFWLVLVFLVAFFYHWNKPRMMENFVKSMAMQVKAQIHEESKLWSTSWPFAKSIRDARKKIRGRNPTTNSFAWLCKILHTMRNHLRQPKDFAHHAKFRMVCKIFLCTDSVRFLAPDILFNFLFSPCNQLRYFHIYLFIYCVCNIFGRHTGMYSLNTCKFS